MEFAPLRILIVDDSPEDREVFRRWISRLSNSDYEIVESESLAEGLENCRQLNPHCVLLDYRLPDGEGLEHLSAFRGEGAVPLRAVIVLTGQGNESIAVQAIKQGAQDYLVKGEIKESSLQRAIFEAIDTVANLQRDEQTRSELRRLATLDPLTGLPNRRSLESRLEQFISRRATSPTPLSLLFIDLDHFKNINDNYGHAAGDHVLIQFAALLRSTLRASDAVGRQGGDEFCLIGSNCDAGAARALAQRLQNRLASHLFDVSHDKTIQLTCSVGIAELTSDVVNARNLIALADEALFQAKRAGRNQIALYRPQ